MLFRSTTITGNSSGATAVIYSVNSPTYSIGDKVIWGGKTWQSITGQVSNNWGTFELNNSDWQFISYNDTDYNVVWDEIEYDIEHDFISMRKDKSNNIVRQTFYEWYDVDDYRGIVLFPWGNDMEYNYYRGFSNNKIDGATYVDLINFRGDYCNDNTFLNETGFSNTFEIGSRLQRNTLDRKSTRLNSSHT